MKLIIACMLLAASVVVAQPRWMDDDDQAPLFERGKFLEKLDLTKDQETQVDQFRSDFQKKNIDLRAKIQTMRVTLRDLFDNDKPDQDKIESQLIDISKSQNELKLNAVSFWFKVNKILKPEQQELWKEHRQMLRQGFGGGRDFGGGFGMKRRGDGFGRLKHGSGRHGNRGCCGSCN